MKRIIRLTKAGFIEILEQYAKNVLAVEMGPGALTDQSTLPFRSQMSQIINENTLEIVSRVNSQMKTTEIVLVG